jgi:rhomboid protease GluP
MKLLDQILRMFGTNRIQVRWRITRLREGMQRRAALSAARKPSTGYKHQLCSSCGHPADGADKQCSRCGTRLHGVAVARAGKLLDSLLPEGMPVATTIFLAACVALYIVTLKASYDLAGADGWQGATASRVQLERYGSNVSGRVFGLHEYWRLVTANFLHAGVMHIGFNGYAIFTIGSLIEERWTRARTVVVLLVTGVAGHALSAWWKFDHGVYGASSVGASTAAFGLMGFVVAHSLRFRHGTAELRQRFIPWLLFGLVMTFASRQIDVWGHLGGLAAGLVLGLFVADKRYARKLLPESAWLGLAALSVGVVVWAFWQCARQL